MIICANCGTSNLDSSNFCDECGTRLATPPFPADLVPSYVPPPTDPGVVVPAVSEAPSRTAQVTSIGLPPIIGPADASQTALEGASSEPGTMNAKLIIERGDAPGVEFPLIGSSSTIGRWDADNGVFPDVDLDQHDSEAKVSRRHARIKMIDGRYVVEDLGSTNGTYINRGRRLLPGSPQPIVDNDEVIVGKTFLRFKIVS